MAVSRFLLTVEARVSSQSIPFGIYGEQTSTDIDFTPRYFGFPL
jgi:hypothetical protein